MLRRPWRLSSAGPAPPPDDMHDQSLESDGDYQGMIKQAGLRLKAPNDTVEDASPQQLKPSTSPALQHALESMQRHRSSASSPNGAAAVASVGSPSGRGQRKDLWGTLLLEWIFTTGPQAAVVEVAE